MLDTAITLPPPDPRFVRGPSELCALATKWDGNVPAGGLVLQEKIDGIRAIWLDRQLVTREGIHIEGVDHVIAELIELERSCGRPTVFDGEFQVGGALKPTLSHFGSRGRRGDAGQLFLFDAIPHEEWKSDACEKPLTARLASLAASVERTTLRHVSALPWSVRGSAATVTAFARGVWDRGGEGAVAKVPASFYSRRKLRTWSKIKKAGQDH